MTICFTGKATKSNPKHLYIFMITDHRTVVVWRFRDGKRGHENQTLGLLQALGRLLPIRALDIAVETGFSYLLNIGLKRPFLERSLPAPDLLIGAGHGTHLPLLAAARARGGRTVVLMKPSLPIRWFDLCVVPEHDNIRPRSNVFITRGVLNPMVRNDPNNKPEQGLFLIGGPSRHYGWDEDALFQQIRRIVTRESGINWIATTSRRTPQSTARALMERKWENLHPILHSDTSQNWLPQQLGQTRIAWVTEDSVSMIYEALTAGAAIGLLPIPRRAASRLSLGVDGLMKDGLVTTFSAWCDGITLRYAHNEFDEAARCARWIAEYWFESYLT
uniref:Fission protein ELM1 n=1 Tax=Candidatus Kentrum sp. MB TaxID=2138164 RepID=A0A451BGJ3_9GAMM|nr:MAG: hypothetical protein BECKMB1821I_GA0114274_11296 [Candidatus Kentron sp. MB]VFK77388.1 MAG: hypothetical protein BECKMB1821H_GA0114242_11316 [Candidatus Kentron sp. MB]